MDRNWSRYRPMTERTPKVSPAPWSWRLAVQPIVELQAPVQSDTRIIRPGTTCPGSQAGVRDGLFRRDNRHLFIISCRPLCSPRQHIARPGWTPGCPARADSIYLSLFNRLRSSRHESGPRKFINGLAVPDYGSTQRKGQGQSGAPESKRGKRSNLSSPELSPHSISISSMLLWRCLLMKMKISVSSSGRPIEYITHFSQSSCHIEQLPIS